MECYQNALQLQPGEPQLHFKIGILCLKEKDKLLALPYLKKVLELDPAYPQKKIVQFYISQLEKIQPKGQKKEKK